MTEEPTVTLELDDMQAALVHPRPTRYAGAVLLGRIDNPRDGRELLRRLIPFSRSGAGSIDPSQVAWATVGISFQGLKALGVPEESLASFPRVFQQGMAARAPELGDTGESAPEHWEQPLGRPDVHLGIYALAPDHARLETALAGARDALRDVPGVTPIWEQDTYMLPTERTSFGFKDGISNPAIEGSGIPATNPREDPFKAGEFVLGYPDEHGDLPPAPQPAALGRNGSYHWVFTTCDVKPGPGLAGCASCANAQLRVEARVFYLANDASAGPFADKNGKIALPAARDAVEYLGSTTGSDKYAKPGNCSPLPVTWNVSQACSPLSITSVGDWCAKENVYKEDHAHGVRPLVQDAKLLSPVK